MPKEGDTAPTSAYGLPMGRGLAENKGSALIYRRPSRREQGDLRTRVTRRFARLSEAISVPDPDPADVAEFERLICGWAIASGERNGLLAIYGGRVASELLEHTPTQPCLGVVTGVEERLDALRRARNLLARVSHRLPVDARDQIIGAYVGADLSAAAGFQSLHTPLADLMEATPLEHRSWPVVFQRRLDPWGSGGVKRAPEGKYLTHFAVSHDEALCGARVSRLGRAGSGLWGVVEDGTVGVTCRGCLEATTRRGVEITMATESPADQITRLFEGIVGRATSGVYEQIEALEGMLAIPMKTDRLTAIVRGCGWNAVVSELEAACQGAGQLLSPRTLQSLRRFPADPGCLGRLPEGAIPAVSV